VRSNLAGTAGHLIGEYREADADDLAADEWYRLGDFKGKSGLEAVYEQELRGRKGVKYHIVDVRNDVRSSVQSGQLDTAAVPGADVTLTIEASLQQYAERLMGGKRGSVVAIEPQTGEVLALVSAPSFDPDLMTGSRRGVAYDSLAHHPGKPLFNRALRATYRPGSIFKMVQGLIALDEGIIAPSTRIPCNRQIINCHGAHSFDNLSEAIMHSCNPYFHEVMKRFVERRDYSSKFEDAAVGLGRWTERIKGFGFGTDLGGHLPGARPGLVPDTAYYDGIYGRRSWAYSTIYSISIGEGELLVTPLQIANVAAIIANRGWYRTPHAVRDVGGRGKPRGLDSLIETGIDPALFQPVIEAMQTVVEQPGGTARRARVEGLEICGKTGTVQDDPRLEHSIFMAFAPKDNPQIAISVYVENAGAGGRWAAPIASLLIEKYLNDSISNPEREARILAAHDPFPDDR
jgi:penicillin-binding protein 2